ncbi:MAG: hypothetical protein ACOX2F_11030 [bacterium]
MNFFLTKGDKKVDTYRYYEDEKFIVSTQNTYYSDSPLEPHVYYYYRITAYNPTYGEGPKSDYAYGYCK